MYQEMTVHGFGLDQATRLPVIILNDTDGRKIPIWLSAGDLVPIATDLIGRELAGARDSVDLVQALLGSLGFTPDRLYLDDREDGGYSSSLQLAGPEGDRIISLAPREAVLMALRYALPVMVSTDLLQRLVIPMGISDQTPEKDPQHHDDFLEKLDPKEMGKYPM